jgi:putative membrane protein
MSKTLVLCVDRDNDFGEKAGVKSPIIGRETNLSAANSLMLQDPEDSDSNALFSAISTYDSLVKSGEVAEIATICGDKNVGMFSDEILGKQIDEVISTVKPTEVVMVSDGAEDDFILPLIQSRMKVRAMKRVTVRQAPKIESMYYIIIKALSEEKFLKKVLVPIGVAFLVLGITILFVLVLRVYLYGLGSLDPATTGFMTVMTAIGIYFLSKAYSAAKRITDGFSKLVEEFVNTRVTVFSLLIATATFAYGVYLGLEAAFQTTQQGRPEALGLIYLIYRLVPFTIAAILIFDLGRIVEGFLIFEKGKRGEAIKLYILSASFYISFFAAVLGLLSFIIFAYQTGAAKSDYLAVAIVLTALGVTLGVIISLLRRRYGKRVEELGPERETAQENRRVV